MIVYIHCPYTLISKGNYQFVFKRVARVTYYYAHANFTHNLDLFLIDRELSKTIAVFCSMPSTRIFSANIPDEEE